MVVHNKGHRQVDSESYNKKATCNTSPIQTTLMVIATKKVLAWKVTTQQTIIIQKGETSARESKRIHHSNQRRDNTTRLKNIVSIQAVELSKTTRSGMKKVI